MHIRTKTAATAAILCAILAASVTASANVTSLPSKTLVSLTAGKTFDAKIAGYGWGEEDDPSSLSIDFTVIEPTSYAAADIESLAADDQIISGYESYTISSVKQDGSSIIVAPKEVWLTPLTFTPADDGSYTAETEDGMVMSDSFTFPGKLSPDLVYVNAEGEELTAAELLRDMSADSIDTSASTTKITFDENGLVTEINFHN